MMALSSLLTTKASASSLSCQALDHSKKGKSGEGAEGDVGYGKGYGKR